MHRTKKLMSAQLCRNELAVLDLGSATTVVRWIQLDVLAETAASGRRFLTSGGLDIESEILRSSLLLSELRPRSALSCPSFLLTTTTIPDNSDFAAPRVACTFRPSQERGTVSLSHSSSSCEGTCGFDDARRKILCGDVKYGDCASDGGTGISTGLLGKRREWLRPRPDFNEAGRGGGVCDAGEGVKDILKPGWPDQ
jgi:hypothetical protein